VAGLFGRALLLLPISSPQKRSWGISMHGLVHGHHVIKWVRNAFVGCALGLGT